MSQPPLPPQTNRLQEILKSNPGIELPNEKHYNSVNMKAESFLFAKQTSIQAMKQNAVVDVWLLTQETILKYLMDTLCLSID